MCVPARTCMHAIAHLFTYTIYASHCGCMQLCKRIIICLICLDCGAAVLLVGARTSAGLPQDSTFHCFFAHNFRQSPALLRWLRAKRVASRCSFARSPCARSPESCAAMQDRRTLSCFALRGKKNISRNLRSDVEMAFQVERVLLPFCALHENVTGASVFWAYASMNAFFGCINESLVPLAVMAHNDNWTRMFMHTLLIFSGTNPK